LYRDQWFKNRSIWLDNLNKNSNDQAYNLGFKGLYTPEDSRLAPMGEVLFKISNKFKKWRVYSYSGDKGVFTHDAKSW
jgi:hypothetical protein